MKKIIFLIFTLSLLLLPWQGAAQITGSTCVNPLVVASVPFNDSGNTATYGNYYGLSDVPPTALGAITDGTGSTSYLGNGDDVVYSYTAGSNGSITINTTHVGGSGWNSLWAFTGCPFASTVGYHTATSGTTRSIPNLPVIAGETYYIVISNWDAGAIDFTIEITGTQVASCLPPTNLGVSNITSTSAELVWNENGTATAWDIEWGTSGFMPTGTPNIAGTTTNPHLLSGLIELTPYEFYVRANCGSGDESSWVGPHSFQTAADCTIYTLSVTATSNDICYEGTTTLTATAGGSGDEIYWYDAAMGGNLVGIGSTFETPFIDETTSFWVAEVINGGNLPGQSFANPTTFSNSTSNAGGLIFTVSNPIIIVDVEVFGTNTTGGDVVIELRDINNGNTTIASTTAAITGGGSAASPIPHTIPLNFVVPAAGNYRLVRSGATPTGVGLGTVSAANSSFPYPLGNSGEVTGGSTLTSTSTTQFFFFNWTIMEAALCESVRDGAVATVYDFIPVDASATATQINPNTSTTLTATSTNTNYIYTWEPASNISGSNVGPSVTTVNLTDHTTFTVTAEDSITGCIATDEITILVFNTALCNDLDIISVDGAYICDEGTAILSATAAGISGDEVYWYDDEFGGNFLASGSTFETPIIDVTTSYWAAEVLLAATLLPGQAFANPTTFTNSAGAGGLLFTVTSPIVIVDVEVFGTNATGGDITIELRDVDNGNVTLASTTVSITGGGTVGAPIPHTIALGFDVPNAGNYRLVKTTPTTGIGLGYVTSANSNFPYPLGTSGEVTGGATATGTSTLQYYFFNWTIQEYINLCESDRMEVVATVVETIPVEATATATQIDPNTSTTLTAVSTNTDYIYTWEPASSIAGSNIGSSVTTTNLTDHTTFTVTATDSVTNCVATDEITIYVFNTAICNTLAITNAPIGYICDEGTVELSATSSGTGNEIYWYDAAVGGNRVGFGSTFETPYLTQTTSYWATEVMTVGHHFPGVGIETPSGTGTNSTVNYGMEFTVTESTKILSVDVLSTSSGGDLSIALYDTNDLVVGNHIAYHTETIVGGNYHTIVLNFDVPAAGTYRLVRAAQSVTIALRSQNTTGVSNPYPIGTIGQINGGHLSLAGTVSNSQYMFYNWTFSTAFALCESARAEVIASVVETVSVEATATATQIDPNTSTTLTAISTNANYAYTWEPASSIAGSNVGASVTTTNLTGHTTFTVTATDTITNCVATDEITILVFDLTLCNPLDITATTGDTICSGETATLSATASGTGNEIYWYDALTGGSLVGEGATFETPALTSTTSYWAAEVLTEAVIINPIETVYTAGASTSLTGTPSSITFAIQNTNSTAVTITEIENLMPANTTREHELWYHPTSLTGPTGTIDAANGWIQIGGPQTTTSGAVQGISLVLDNLSFSIPANTTYRFALLKTDNISGVQTFLYWNASAAPNVFSDGGINIFVGNSDAGTGSGSNVGYSGTLSPTNTPRAFSGIVHFDAIIDLCESSRTEAVATVSDIIPVVASANQTTINPGNSTTLNASSTNANYIYEWTWQGGGPVAGASVMVSPMIHTTYTVTATDTVTGCMATDEVLILVIDPTLCNLLDITATTGDTICIGETAILSATASGTGTEIYWYDDQFAGNKVGEGATFETPPLTSTTSYWAAEVLSTAEGTIQASYASPSLFFIDTGGALTFTVNNNNSTAIQITDIAHYATANNTASWTLWYNPTDISGVASDVTAANGWIQAAPSQMATNPGAGAIIPVISDISVFVPANTSYRFALQADNNLYYAGATTSPNAFTLDNVSLWVGDNPNSTGSSGGFPVVSTNAPRFFYGSVTFESLELCESDREEAIATVTSDDAPIGSANQNFTAGQTLADLIVTGTNLTWYSDAAGTTVLPETTLLVHGETYCVSQTVNGCESQLLCITVVEVFCDAPTALSLGTVTPTTAQFSWTASADETGGYAWYVFAAGANPNTATPVATGNVGTGITTVNVSSLSASTAYDFYVATLCTGGVESAKAGPLNFTTAALPCDAPTALILGTVTHNTAQFSWTASADETGGYAWYVFAAGANPNTATPVATGNVGTGITTVNVSSLSASTAYDFYVATLCTGGVESAKAGPLNFTTAALPCDAPTALSLGTVTHNTAQFSWTASANETGGYAWYVFTAGANPNTATPVAAGNVGTGITTVNVSSLSASTAYDFYVATLCTGGVESAKAGPLNFTTTALPCDMPTAITLGTVEATTAELSWTASATETNGYVWAVFNTGDDPLVDPAVTSGTVASGVTTVIVTGLTPETTYDFYVRTDCDPNGMSDWEGPSTFTTDMLSVNDFGLNSIAFYPNPMVDVVNITAQVEIEKVVVYSLTGQLLIEQRVGNTETQIDVSNFASGPYLMYVTTSTGKVGIFRLIKK